MPNEKLTFQYIFDLVLNEKKILPGTLEEREESFLDGLPVLKQEAYHSIKEMLKQQPDGLTASEMYRDVIHRDENGKRPVQIKQFEKFLQQINKLVGMIDFDIYKGTYKLAATDDAGEDIETQKEAPTIEDPEFDDLDSSNIENEHPSIKGAYSDYKRSLGHEDY